MADAEKHLNLEAGVSSSCLLEGRFGSRSGFNSPWASLMLGRNGVLKSPSRQQISAQGGLRAAHMPWIERWSRPAVCVFFLNFTTRSRMRRVNGEVCVFASPKMPWGGRGVPIHPSFRDALTRAGPESRAALSQDWIPGSRFPRPGMTK